MRPHEADGHRRARRVGEGEAAARGRGRGDGRPGAGIGEAETALLIANDGRRGERARCQSRRGVEQTGEPIMKRPARARNKRLVALVVPVLERVVEAGVHFVEMTLPGIVPSSILRPAVALFSHIDRLGSLALPHRT